MDSENPIGRHFRNASQQRLILYGVILVAVIVAVILLFTLVLAGDKPNPEPKPSEFIGRDVLKEVPLVDGYNNLPARLFEKLSNQIANFDFDKDLSLEDKTKWAQTDLPKLKSGMVGSQVWTIKTPCSSQYKDTVAKTLQQLDTMYRLIKKYKDQLRLILSSEDINTVFKENKIGSILAIDGGHSIDNKLAALRLFHKLGVRYVTLTSGEEECSTPWSSSYNKPSGDAQALTKFGTNIIQEMNHLGMIIDLTHSSYDAQKLVLAASKSPVIFSSSATTHNAIHPQNIKDDILDLLVTNKGLVMVSFNPDFITPKEGETVTMDHVVEQLNYLKTKIGVNHIGIGAGFNAGTGGIKGLENSSKYPDLFDRLAKPQKENEVKWTKDELKKLAYYNFLRVYQSVELVSNQNNAACEELIPEDDLKGHGKECYTKTV